MQFNITFKTIFEYVLKKLVLCIQIRFVSTEKTTRIASRASCYRSNWGSKLLSAVSTLYFSYGKFHKFRTKTINDNDFFD